MARRLPNWLVKRAVDIKELHNVKAILRKGKLSTVCEEARCPNMAECFKRPTATFMIMGDVCTRNCTFCSVSNGNVKPLDPQEPKNVAMAVKEMGLKYAVITSVTRDDISDGGASHFADTIKEIKKICPNTKIEVLIPDFQGNESSVKIVCEANPDVINHNIETVPRLYKDVRPQADYGVSLSIFAMVKRFSSSIYTKSGIMVGLGERKDEVISVMKDLRRAGCEMLTIGQYLTPTKESIPVAEYIHPDIFKYYEKKAKELGFIKVASAPFVRSSYMADLQFNGEI
ncbi:MAG: lipoyl synthase [Candidatus Schekmanbacteria bacterium]|nr:MAG: lipoyl synthase [Candidatus Schekmanbacteria bacterium]